MTVQFSKFWDSGLPIVEILSSPLHEWLDVHPLVSHNAFDRFKAHGNSIQPVMFNAVNLVDFVAAGVQADVIGAYAPYLVDTDLRRFAERLAADQFFWDMGAVQPVPEHLAALLSNSARESALVAGRREPSFAAGVAYQPDVWFDGYAEFRAELDQAFAAHLQRKIAGSDASSIRSITLEAEEAETMFHRHLIERRIFNTVASC